MPVKGWSSSPLTIAREEYLERREDHSWPSPQNDRMSGMWERLLSRVLSERVSTVRTRRS